MAISWIHGSTIYSVRETENCNVGLGVHLALALRPYSFSVVMDEVTKEI